MKIFIKLDERVAVTLIKAIAAILLVLAKS